MDRHVKSMIVPHRDEADDRMPDLDSIVPLLSPPLVFRNGKILSRRSAMERRKESEPPVGARLKRFAPR